MKLDEHCMRNLKETIKSLQDAFPWAQSPHGFDYWEDVTNNLLDIWDANGGDMGLASRPAHPYGVDKHLVRQAEESLRSSFVWDTSEQGHDYWAEVRENLQSIYFGNDDWRIK